jgi:ribosomal subunit interface protein
MVVRGRNVVVPEHFRVHVSEKLAKIERYDHKIIRIDVELYHERNPRQNDRCQHVEITCRSKGPVVRAEACADDFYKALELAVEKLERRLWSAADRRRHHHRRRRSKSVGEMPGLPLSDDGTESAGIGLAAGEDGREPDERLGDNSDMPEEGPGRIVRQKVHPAVPMSVDDALFEMELVGHDFYLFHDKDTDRPSVVYRRRAYDYGLIRLGDTSEAAAGSDSAESEESTAGFSKK